MKTKLHQIRYYLLHLLRATRKGHGVHSPFAYFLCEEVFYNVDGFYEFENLKDIRNFLLQDKTSISVMDLGAGSQRLKANSRSISEIAKHGISTFKQSEILFRLIHVLNLKKVIELGTSLGLNTLYLRSAAPLVYTIEGNPELSEFASELASQKGYADIHFIKGNFDEVFKPVLKEIQTFDLLYIDGNHRYESTMRYFRDSLMHSHNDSVIILDDIYWSPEMTKAWKEICQFEEVRLALDLYHFGILFFRKEIKEKQILSLLI